MSNNNPDTRKTVAETIAENVDTANKYKPLVYVVFTILVLILFALLVGRSHILTRSEPPVAVEIQQYEETAPVDPGLMEQPQTADPALINQPAPTLTPVPPPTASAPAGEQTHVVQSGENLYRIGLRYGFTADELVAYNNIPDASRIDVGQVIKIPPPKSQ